MKPIKLEIEGLNSFESKQTLNFSELGEGVFGIFGKTGSVKSTVLVAITLALYGKVERSKQNIDFINTKSKKAIVGFEFEVTSSAKPKNYFIKRTFSVKKNGKDVDSSAELYEVATYETNLIEEGVTRVDAKIFSIIGLGQSEFSKCIALPQGDFSAVLKSKPSERTEIMSNIFDLSAYGEKLAGAVKSKVQTYDKQVEVFSSNLELVSYATDEALALARENFETSSSKYNELSASLNEKKVKFVDIKTNLEKQTKLSAVEAELEKLSSSQTEMENLSKEIAKNTNANAIKSDYEKLNKTKEDERELTEKIARLNENKLKIQTEAEEAKREFDEFNEKYNSLSVELNSKLARLDDLQNYENEIKALEHDKAKTETQIDEAKKNLAGFGEKLEFIQSNLEIIDKKIKDIDDFIEASKPDVDLSYALEQTKGIESEIILIEDFYKKLEILIDQTEADLKAVQEEYNSAIREEKQIIAKREKIQNSIEVAFEDSDTTNFKKLRSADKELCGMGEAESTTTEIDSVISKIELDTENRMATISSLNEQIDAKQAELDEMEGQIQAKTAEGEALAVEREEMLGNNVISMMSDHLKVGDICPVCESRVSQKVYSEKLDLGGIEGEIQKNQTEVKGRRFERDKIFVELATLKSRYEFEKAEIEINKNEIKDFKEKKSKIYQKFVDLNDKTPENFEKLKSLLSDTVTKLEELIVLEESLRTEEQRVRIIKTQSGTKVSLYKNYLENLIDIGGDLQAKKAEREFVIQSVNEKYKNLKEYKKQIADGKNVEIQIDTKKEEKAKLREDEHKIGEERIAVQKDMASAGANLDVLNEKLSSFEKQIAGTKSKIVLSGVPENVSLDAEKENLKKEIAKLKFDFDEKQTKLYSANEHVSRITQEYEVNSSILENKRKEISELSASVNQKMSDGEFADSVELESNFVSQSVLKLKQNRLNDYDSRKRVLEIQKQELVGEITQKVDEVQANALSAEIEKLDSEVKNLSQNVGKTSADYNRILEANAKFNELSKSLEVAKKNLDLAKELSSVLKGKALAEYVAEEYLQEITVSANEKLSLLMDGRYTLKFENKEFVVEDNFNDAETRPASTLSGGETFLVSLALALSISEAITMLSSRNMEFFFLDEGFGTLDEELCETVVGALYKLESQNLKIGLISHIKELEEKIKNKVLITKDNKGSHIEISHSL